MSSLIRDCGANIINHFFKNVLRDFFYHVFKFLVYLIFNSGGTLAIKLTGNIMQYNIFFTRYKLFYSS